MCVQTHTHTHIHTHTHTHTPSEARGIASPGAGDVELPAVGARIRTQMLGKSSKHS